MLQTIDISLPELLERVRAGQIPMSARAKVTYDDAAISEAQNAATNPNPALALFEQWDKEDAQVTPEQQAENERIYAEIERNGIPRIRL